MTDLTSRFRRWFDYERDAHDKTLASLRTVPEERRGREPYEKAIDLLAHIAAARSLWLCRCGAAETGPDSAEELFPKELSVDEVSRRLHTVHGEWSEYLSSLDDEGVARSFEYVSHEGERFRNTIEDVLSQLFTHSSYHRGQIASIVRSLGGEPAVTDFVFWSRSELSH